MYHQNVGRYNWNIVESGAKHHKPKPPPNVGSKVNLKWRINTKLTEIIICNIPETD